MRYVALDTQVLIWGMKDECTPGQEQMKERARILLLELDKDDAQVILPTVSLAELMAPMSDRQSSRFLAEAEERFVCVPFDSRSAYVAAKLWREHRKLPTKEQLKRTLLKADCHIIASAYTAGAREFFSHDANCRRLAKSLMTAKDLPMFSEEMF